MTPATCAHHAEAAAIAFDAHHAPDIELTIVDRGHSEGYGHGWTPTTQRQRDAWASHNTTMEYGAYSVAVATIEATRNLRVVSRSADRSGADWRVGSADPVTEGELDLDSYPRLEVSGTDDDAAEVARRVTRKVAQVRAAGRGPGMVVVVGFSMRRVVVRDA